MRAGENALIGDGLKRAIHTPSALDRASSVARYGSICSAGGWGAVEVLCQQAGNLIDARFLEQCEVIARHFVKHKTSRRKVVPREGNVKIAATRPIRSPDVYDSSAPGQRPMKKQSLSCLGQCGRSLSELRTRFHVLTGQRRAT